MSGGGGIRERERKGERHRGGREGNGKEGWKANLQVSCASFVHNYYQL